MKALVFLLIVGICLADRIPTNQQTFTVTTATKTVKNNYFQQGFAVGYLIDGIENTSISLYVGRNYTFNVQSSCLHPFYISTDPSGQGIGEVRDASITASNGNYNQVCGGVQMYWIPTDAQVGTVFYYQCRTHSKMGWKISVVDEPFCDKYSRILQYSNFKLVSTVVGQVLTNLTDPKSSLLPYFNGQYGGTNFTDPNQSAALQKLTDHLVQFFGLALGCPDPAYPPYTGNPDLKAVHQPFAIGKPEFDTFNQVVIDVMASDGVSVPDQSAVLAVLQSLSQQICNDPNSCKNSICDRYAALLGITDQQLVNTVVVETFTAAVQPASPIRGFFNGTTPSGSIDFTTNMAQQTRLVTDLVAFFGQAGILTCTDPAYPAYTKNTDLKAIHAAMPIGTKEFETFNGALIQVLKNHGVSQPDRDAVMSVLESTKTAICNQPDCSGNVVAGITFVFEVVPKVNHPFVGKGYASGFQVDGLEGRPLSLVVGKVYTFTNNGICSHPLYVSTDMVGAGAGEVTDGITYPGGDPYQVCNGKSLTFVPTAAQVGMTMYYQCRNHMYMGYTIMVYSSQNNIPVTTGSGTISLAAVTTTNAVTQTGGSTTAAQTGGSTSGQSVSASEASTTAAAAGDASVVVPSVMFLFALIALLL